MKFFLIVPILLACFLNLSVLSEAKASPNGDLYKACKSLVDNNFEDENATHVWCKAYFWGVAGLMWYNCDAGGALKAEFKKQEMEAYIQNYVNKMRNTPEKWQYNAGLAVAEAIMDIARDC